MSDQPHLFIRHGTLLLCGKCNRSEKDPIHVAPEAENASVRKAEKNDGGIVNWFVKGVKFFFRRR